MGGPVNGTDHFVVVVTLWVSDHGHGGEEALSELFGSVDRELVDSHSVGLSLIGVVLVDEDEVLFKDESAVGFFFGGEVEAELSLPLLEGVSPGTGGGVENGEHCNGDQ